MIKRITLLLAVILTARLGTVNFDGHKETFYNLKMRRVCANATEKGIPGQYWERADGCKMFGDFIICAAHYGTHPYGSTVQTSLGTAIVLDTGTFANTNTEQIDIATTW